MGHRRKAPVHGCKAHVAADADGGIVRSVEITPANVNDGRMLTSVLPKSPGEVYGDLAYASAVNEQEIRAAGGQPRLPGRGVWAPAGDGAALARLEAWTAQVGRIRRRIEKIFGTGKRSYGRRRMRWRGLARAALQVRLTAMAYNLRRAIGIVRAAAA